jgi:hypothetical protein
VFRYFVIVALVIGSLGWATQAAPQDDFAKTLSRAQTLYYEARFSDSIQILLPLDAELGQQQGRAADKVSIKLLLALGHVGLNQMDQAKSRFQELCGIDSDYSLDPAQYAPKVLSLFNEAKADQLKTKCGAVCAQVETLTKNNDYDGLLKLISASGSGCACVGAAASTTAETLYKEGLDAYKRDDIVQALQKFRLALKFRPQHDLAIQYAELADNKIRLTVDQSLLEWRKHFEAREFPQAAADYRKLDSTNVEGKANSALDEIRTQYRKNVSSRVESWKQSCSTNTNVSLDAFRKETNEFLPDAAIAADLLSGLSPCAPPPPAPVTPASAPAATTRNQTTPAPRPTSPPAASAPAAPAGACVDMPWQLAMTRVKTRVEPNIAPNRLPTRTMTIRLKLRIAENGNVTVNSVAGEDAYLNEQMRAAVAQWKFVPAVVQDQPRCVDTEIPINLGRQ